MTPEQKPFFAGTYFPKTTKYGQNGLSCKFVNKLWKQKNFPFQKTKREVFPLVKWNRDIEMFND